jgi:hypothetical protein
MSFNKGTYNIFNIVLLLLYNKSLLLFLIDIILRTKDILTKYILCI